VALTPHALDRMGVPWLMIVEEQQRADYARRYPSERLLTLPREYQATYHTGDDKGDSLPKGAGPARNFAWDHAIASGAEWHWLMDDNLRCFARLHQSQRRTVGDGMVLAAMEDFVLRYENIGMAGPQYLKFAPSREAMKHPYVLNRRIFSCNLIRNDIGLRWRGRWSEDLDLSIQVLRAGWCTVLFRAFLADKITTQKIPGGYTDGYLTLSTLPKSQLAAAMNPDIVKVVWRYHRWHHEADFSEFNDMRLIRKAGWAPPEVNPYAKTHFVPNPAFRQKVNPPVRGSGA